MCQLLGSGVPLGISALYVEVIYAFQETRSNVAWIGSICFAFFFGLGVVTSIIIGAVGIRPVVLAGAFMCAFGLCVSFFAPSVPVMYFTIGVITGIGANCLLVTGLMVTPHCFDRGRTLAMTGNMAAFVLAGTYYPQLVVYLSETYGWRGALLIWGAIAGNSMIFALFVNTPKSSNGTENQMKRIFHVSIFCEPVYMIGVFCAMVGSMISIVPSIFIVDIMKYKLGIEGDDNDEAVDYAVYLNIANVVSRPIGGLAITVLKMDSFLFVAIFILLYAVVFEMFLLTSLEWHYIVVVLLMGVAYGNYSGVLPVMAMDAVGLERYHSAIGFVMTWAGVGMGLGPPLIGYLYDITGDYNLPLHVCSGVMFAVGLIVLVLAIVRWLQRTGRISQFRNPLMPMPAKTGI